MNKHSTTLKVFVTASQLTVKYLCGTLQVFCIYDKIVFISRLRDVFRTLQLANCIYCCTIGYVNMIVKTKTNYLQYYILSKHLTDKCYLIVNFIMDVCMYNIVLSYILITDVPTKDQEIVKAKITLYNCCTCFFDIHFICKIFYYRILYIRYPS